MAVAVLCGKLLVKDGGAAVTWLPVGFFAWLPPASEKGQLSSGTAVSIAAAAQRNPPFAAQAQMRGEGVLGASPTGFEPVLQP